MCAYKALLCKWKGATSRPRRAEAAAAVSVCGTGCRFALGEHLVRSCSLRMNCPRSRQGQLASLPFFSTNNPFTRTHPPHFLKHSGAFRFQSRAVDVGDFWCTLGKTKHVQEDCQAQREFSPGPPRSPTLALSEGRSPLHLPANCCAFYFREHMPSNLAQWQARTLPQDWRNMVFGAMSDLR